MTVLRATYRGRGDVDGPTAVVDVDLADHNGDWGLAYESAHAATPEGCVLLHVTREDPDRE